MRLRGRNQRGNIAVFLALTASIMLSAVVLGGGARIAPFVAETRRQRASDQARVLAESGVLAARENLRHYPMRVGQAEYELEGGRIEVRIERGEEGEVIVESIGVAPDRESGPDGSATRRVRVVLRPLLEGGYVVADWKDL